MVGLSTFILKVLTAQKLYTNEVVMEAWEQIFYGFSGFVALELFELSKRYDSGKFPQKYKKPGYWITRVLLSGTTGVLVMSMGINNPLFCFQAGFTAPLLWEKWKEGDPNKVDKTQ